MKPCFYEGVLEKECYKHLAVNNGDKMLGCSIIIEANFREHAKYKSVLLYDLTILDKTKLVERKDQVTIRISPRGFHHKLSHYYRAGNQAFEHRPSSDHLKSDSVEEALSSAASEMFSFYKLNDDLGEWVPSTSYKE